MIRLMGPKHPKIKCRTVAVLQVIHPIKLLAKQPRAKVSDAFYIPKFWLFILNNGIEPRNIRRNVMIRGAGQQGDSILRMMGPYSLKGAHGLDKIPKGSMLDHQDTLGHSNLR
jgi:hypothetical protein